MGRRGVVASAGGCGPCSGWELLAREAPRQGWWTRRWRQGRRHFVYPPARARAEAQTSLQPSLQALFQRDGLTVIPRKLEAKGLRGEEGNPRCGRSIGVLAASSRGGCAACAAGSRRRRAFLHLRLEKVHLGSPCSDCFLHKEHLNGGKHLPGALGWEVVWRCRVSNHLTMRLAVG